MNRNPGPSQKGSIGQWRKLVVFCSIIVLVTAAQLPPSLVSADTKVVTDPEDTGDVMDLKTARHGHGPKPWQLKHILTTYESWEWEEFDRAHILLWTRRDDCPRYVLVIERGDNANYIGIIYDSGCDRFPSGDVRGYAKVERTGERKLVAIFRKSVLRKQLDKYWWKAELFYPCSRDPDIQCTPPPPDTHEHRVLHRLTD